MPKKKKRAYLNEDGKWECRVRDGVNKKGKRKYKYFRGSTKEEVLMLAECYEKVISNRSKLNVSVSELADFWFEKKRTSGELKENSISTYLNGVNTIKSYWGEKKVYDIDEKDLEAFYEMVSSKFSQSAKTFVIGIYDAIIALNMSDIEPLIENHCNRQKKDTLQNLINCDEMQMLRESCSEIADPYATAILIILYTGMKIGEICSLKWEDIDFLTGEIIVNKTMTRVKNFDDDKKSNTKISISEIAERRIPMCRLLKFILKQRCTEGYVTTGDDSFVEPRTFQYRLGGFFKGLGFDKKITTNMIRESVIINALSSNVNVKFVSKVVGIDTVHMVDVYESYIDWTYSEKEEVEKI